MEEQETYVEDIGEIANKFDQKNKKWYNLSMQYNCKAKVGGIWTLQKICKQKPEGLIAQGYGFACTNIEDRRSAL